MKAVAMLNQKSAAVAASSSAVVSHVFQWSWSPFFVNMLASLDPSVVGTYILKPHFSSKELAWLLIKLQTASSNDQDDPDRLSCIYDVLLPAMSTWNPVLNFKDYVLASCLCTPLSTQESVLQNVVEAVHVHGQIPMKLEFGSCCLCEGFPLIHRKCTCVKTLQAWVSCSSDIPGMSRVRHTSLEVKGLNMGTPHAEGIIKYMKVISSQRCRHILFQNFCFRISVSEFLFQNFCFRISEECACTQDIPFTDEIILDNIGRYATTASLEMLLKAMERMCTRCKKVRISGMVSPIILVGLPETSALQVLELGGLPWSAAEGESHATGTRETHQQHDMHQLLKQDQRGLTAGHWTRASPATPV